jgi:flagellar biosynthetic protein FliP
MDALASRILVIVLLMCGLAGAAPLPSRTSAPAPAHPTTAPASTAAPLSSLLQNSIPDLTKKENVTSTIELVVLLAVLSLAPAIILMMTSFTRIIIVLTLLRQALGAQNLPPNQVLTGLAIFMTFLVMGPTLGRINNDALQPYLHDQIDQKTAFDRAQKPVRQFMTKQIQLAGNDADVFVFTDAAHEARPKTWDEVSFSALIPAFILSELKTAFLMGFKIYLPFLIIDLVVSTVLVSMGMVMLPPVLVSLPFKLAMFVLVDGWRLITGNLLGSFVSG